jgi:hypothetical protein
LVAARPIATFGALTVAVSFSIVIDNISEAFNSMIVDGSLFRLRPRLMWFARSYFRSASSYGLNGRIIIHASLLAV